MTPNASLAGLPCGLQTLRKQQEKDEELRKLQQQRNSENARKALERKLELKTKVEEVRLTRQKRCTFCL